MQYEGCVGDTVIDHLFDVSVECTVQLEQFHMKQLLIRFGLLWVVLVARKDLDEDEVSDLWMKVLYSISRVPSTERTSAAFVLENSPKL
jgi:hypothetical protein